MVSADFVKQFRCFQLLHQFGVSTEFDVTPDGVARRSGRKTYNVFYVPDAVGVPICLCRKVSSETGVKIRLVFWRHVAVTRFIRGHFVLKIPVPRETASLCKSCPQSQNILAGIRQKPPR